MEMQDKQTTKLPATEEGLVEKHGNTMIWILALTMAVILTAIICLSVAFSGINQAKRESATAHLGYIHATMLYAEEKLSAMGLTSSSTLISSYDGPATYSEYERNLLGVMTEVFGHDRSFDFAVTRYSDSLGDHLQIFYYPVGGRTDARRDTYYTLQDGVFVAHNQ